MMRRILLLISVLMTMAVSAIAAANNVTDANIGGHVIDGENGDHMPGVSRKNNRYRYGYDDRCLGALHLPRS